MAGCPRGLVAFVLLFPISQLLFPYKSLAVTAPPLCPRSDRVFLSHLGSLCPRWIDLSPPLEELACFEVRLRKRRLRKHILRVPAAKQVRGDVFEELTSGDQNDYYSVLFHASWCPFSQKTRPTFDALSSMFPQIKHLIVEESSADPSVLSRNGIHSFPAIMLINGTTRLRYHGSKNVTSLVDFYQENTGLDPIIVSMDQASQWNARTYALQFESARELVIKEPYLAFSILFICLRIITCFFPAVFFRIKSFWLSHSSHLNLRAIRESSQLLEQVLHVVDVKRFWSNLRLSNKTMNFRKGANNARAWASSFASVSLGESSSSSSLTL